MAMATELPCDVTGGGRSPEDDVALPLHTFFFVGVVQLVGWNAVLTGSGFLDHEIFPGRQWAFLAAITYASGVTVGQALMIRGPLPNLPFSARWILSIALMVLAPLGLLLIVAGANSGRLDVGASYGAALACVIVLSFGGAIFQASTFGLAGAAHPALSGRVMMGQGFGGIFTAVTSVFAPGIATFGGLVGAVTVLTAFAFVVYFVSLHRHPYIRPLLQHMAEDRRLPPSPSTSLSPPSLLPTAPLSGTPFSMASPRRRGRLIAVDVGPQAAGVLFVFMVTFSVFPGVVNRWSGAFGLSDTHFVTFMVGEFQLLDVVGRTIGGFVRKPSGKVTLALSVGRVLFVPLFMGAQRFEGSFLASGGWKILLMAVFAFSNGFVSTLGMMLGPERVPVKEEKETAGHMMSLALVSGILVGSLLALLTQLG